MEFKLRYLSLFFLISSFIFSGCTDQREDRDDPGTITGTVMGNLPNDNNPNPVFLSNIIIEVYESNRDLSQNPSGTATTDETGHYWLEGLKPGTHIIVIDLDGFELYVSTEITVRSGQTLENATITLTPST